jgi:phosphopantetheinyl transferase
LTQTDGIENRKIESRKIAGLGQAELPARLTAGQAVVLTGQMGGMSPAAIWRRILGIALSCPPDQLDLRRGPFGKPALFPDAGLGFNAAHTGGHFAFALMQGAKVGVDIERPHPVPEALAIARDWPEPDRQWIAQDPSPDMRVFLRLWTLREAMVKAMGLGLAALPRLDGVTMLDTDGEVRECLLGVPELGAVRLCALEGPDEALISLCLSFGIENTPFPRIVCMSLEAPLRV